jgi:hypothetical protein
MALIDSTGGGLVGYNWFGNGTLVRLEKWLKSNVTSYPNGVRSFFLHSNLTRPNCKMSGLETAEVRKGSVTSNQMVKEGLSSEDDAAVLGERYDWGAFYYSIG